MPDARIGPTQISPVSGDNASNKTQAPDATGKLGRFKVAGLKLSESGFLNRIGNLFSKKTSKTALSSRKITKTPVEPKLSQPINKKTARTASGPVKDHSAVRKNKDKSEIALHALKNQPGASNSFKKLDKALMTVVKVKADMQAHRRNMARREASLELQLAQQELKQAVNEFNSKASAAGLEPLNTYDLELAMLNGHIDGFDEDKANLEKYQAIKQALS